MLATNRHREQCHDRRNHRQQPARHQGPHRLHPRRPDHRRLSEPDHLRRGRHGAGWHRPVIRRGPDWPGPGQPARRPDRQRHGGAEHRQNHRLPDRSRPVGCVPSGARRDVRRPRPGLDAAVRRRAGRPRLGRRDRGRSGGLPASRGIWGVTVDHRASLAESHRYSTSGSRSSLRLPSVSATPTNPCRSWKRHATTFR